MTRGDKLLVLLIMVSAIMSAYVLLCNRSNKDSSHQAVISVEGLVVRTITLSRETPRQDFVINGKVGKTDIEVQGRRIRVRDAHCNNRICVRQGWIDKPGESVICMPGQVVISIEGAAPVDAVTR
ncbi:MAG: NusG domain II-containing protein [Geobacteraceae bacterium]|nr:NusG domain II-containing protein [Geobacteraceae bacterium]